MTSLLLLFSGLGSHDPIDRDPNQVAANNRTATVIANTRSAVIAANLRQALLEIA